MVKLQPNQFIVEVTVPGGDDRLGLAGGFVASKLRPMDVLNAMWGWFPKTVNDPYLPEPERTGLADAQCWLRATTRRKVLIAFDKTGHKTMAFLPDT